MTDITTRTSEGRSKTTESRPDETQPIAAPSAADDGSTEPLSTADIAGGRPADDGASAPGERDAAGATDAVSGPARRHESDIPGPTVAPLFADDAAGELKERWTDIQAGFVDEPRASVERADALVAEVMQRLADSFATEREALERQWSRGDDASTEDLRVALRRYRSFFDRLLAI
jgi:hypothetical protein